MTDFKIQKTLSNEATSYPIPLSDGETAVIMFSSLPVKVKDIEAIKKWLEYFAGNITEL